MGQIKISPSILSCDPALFRPAVEEMVAAGCDSIHFDVMDGQFVPPITFGADLAASLRSVGGLPFDAHLMTLTPENHFDAFIKAGVQRISFHIETTPHAHRLCQELRSRGIEAAVALNPATSHVELESVLEVCDAILVMTVNPGWGGQKLIESCLSKIAKIRAMAPDIDIVVDGGVDDQTIARLYDAGATTFVTGSYLMKAPSIAEGMRRLREACSSRL